MNTVSQVADNIYQIDTLVRMPHELFVYFIQDEYPSIVETGPSASVPAILEALRYLGQEPGELTYVFITHIHMDHSGGVGYLVRRLPRMRVIAHPQGVRHLVDPSKLIAGARGVFGENFQEAFGPILPVPEELILPVQDGEIVSLGKKELKVIYSPGHAHHHLSFFETRSRGLFVGEALGNILPGTDFVLPPVAPPKFDLAAYIETLNKLRALSPSLVFYPHNGAQEGIERRFQLTYDSLRMCFRIVAEAMKAGESYQQIARRFLAYIPTETVEEFDLLVNNVITQIVEQLKAGKDFLEVSKPSL